MGISFKRVSIIAAREFNATVKRREFVLVTLGLPLLYILIAVFTGGVTASAARTALRSEPPTRIIGFLDKSGLLNPEALEEKRGGVQGRVFASEQAGKQAVLDKQVRLFVVVDEKFEKKGEVTLYAPEKSGFFGSSRREDTSYVTTLRRALLSGKVDKRTVGLATRPMDSHTLTADGKGNFAAPNVMREVGKFVVPYAFSLLLLLSVVMGSSYLLHGIVEEKENRVIEVLLSAATHEELLAGKILGLGGVSLAQIGVWVSGTVLVLLAIAARFPQAASLVASPGLVGVALLLFVLGYALNATLMAGFGAMGTSWRESSQVASFVVMPLVVPLMIIPVFLETPNAPVCRFLSLFPLTSPIAMMLRVAVGSVPVWEIALCALFLFATFVLFLQGAARLFRLSLLLYGQRPDAKLVLRHLFAR
jgi:ABC-2 type transport system permease protein